MSRLLRYLTSPPIIWGSAIATLAGGICIVKDLKFGSEYTGEEQLNDKVVIVTGANTGIGKEVARYFANRGAKVIMACRDMVKCEETRQEIALAASNKYVYCRTCNLASQESIRRFVERFKNEHKQLHYLINNAGIMNCPRTLTNEGIEAQLGVNFMGHFLLTNLLLDTLKASAPSKILNVSNISYLKGNINAKDLNSEEKYDPQEAYEQSQLAIAIFTKELDSRLKDTGVTVNAVYPGLTHTDITRHMNYQKSIFGKLWVTPMSWLFSKAPKQAAVTIMTAALNPDYRDVSGSYYNQFEVTQINEKATDEKLNKWLWKVGEVWTHLNTT